MEEQERRGLEKYWLCRIRAARAMHSYAYEQLRHIAEGFEQLPADAQFILSRARRAERAAFAEYWRAIDIFAGLGQGIQPPDDDDQLGFWR
jgi:hypothetical protein